MTSGYDVRTVQELLGHRSVRITMYYTYVLNRVGKGVLSPADRLRLADSGCTESSSLRQGLLRACEGRDPPPPARDSSWGDFVQF
ncbi:MAG: tyrosine-type recombinase/integrase [Deltaproteobacteria bacterium]|nr:tyrosine-type recombinase/integrase [Deltaproteobacteria bacterium]